LIGNLLAVSFSLSFVYKRPNEGENSSFSHLSIKIKKTHVSSQMAGRFSDNDKLDLPPEILPA
jgi:hypothetical protein